MIVEKPWGYENIWVHTDKYVGKVLHINKGECLSLQYHQLKDESIYMIRGIMELEIDEGGMETVQLKEGDYRRIPPLTKHRMKAIEDTDIIEVSTPELEDVVRLEDKYGRVS